MLGKVNNANANALLFYDTTFKIYVAKSACILSVFTESCMIRGKQSHQEKSWFGLREHILLSQNLAWQNFKVYSTKTKLKETQTFLNRALAQQTSLNINMWLFAQWSRCFLLVLWPNPSFSSSLLTGYAKTRAARWSVSTGVGRSESAGGWGRLTGGGRKVIWTAFPEVTWRLRTQAWLRAELSLKSGTE